MHRSQLQSATASHLADADLVTCMQLASFKGELHACHQSLTNTRQLMLRARVAEDRALGGEKDRLKTDLESLQVEHEGRGVERDGLASKGTECEQPGCVVILVGLILSSTASVSAAQALSSPLSLCRHTRCL